MEDNELKLYCTFSWGYFLLPAMMIAIPVLCHIFNAIDDITMVVITTFFYIAGIFFLVIFAGANIFRKVGYIFTSEGIVSFSMFHRRMLPWKEIVSYSVTESPGGKVQILNFQTAESLKRDDYTMGQNAISISSKFYKLNIPQFVEVMEGADIIAAD